MQLTFKGLFLTLCSLSSPFIAQAKTTPSITVSPGYTNVGVLKTVQYTATVKGLTNTAITWEVNQIPGGNSSIGTISTTGLYTAPATVPTVSTLIVALGSDGKTMGVQYVNVEATGPSITAITPDPIPTGSYSVTIHGAGFQSGAIVQAAGANLTTTFVNSTTLTASGYQSAAGTVVFEVQNPGTLFGSGLSASFESPQTISPITASVKLGATKQFTSTGATSWTATAGTISATGLYTAPATMPSSSTVTVTATGPGGSASATVTLVSVHPQQISPTVASLNLGTSQQFTSAGATSWQAVAGTVSSSGLYTAPATMPASGTDSVTATGAGGSASATITLIAPQVIAPSSVTLALGATQQFTSAGGTTWAATYGSVTSTGLYTAPATLPVSGSDTVTVTGPDGTAVATVTILPPTPAITSVGGGNQLPLGVFTATVSGSGFTPESVVSLNGTALSTSYSSGGSLSVTGFVGQSGTGTLTVTNGSFPSQPFAVQVGVQNALVSPAAARRFLEQAAFGPTPSDAATVQSIGPAAWIAQQFTMPQMSNYDIITSDQGGMSTHFLNNAVNNPDQLRQRVAFALSQVWVTSINTLIWNTNMVSYQDMLLNDAFGNYRQIMEDVTLSPAMGQYLNMANNAMGDPTTGAEANQNYARELMQLFTLGTNLLNPDGTVQLDGNNQPIPTYTQPTIAEFSRVYTGWTYAPQAGQPVNWNDYINSGNMVPFPAEHDSGSKQLLNGVTAPAGMTPQQDLDFALDNIFNHPNLAPFVSTLLIQHLVKSNPSPAYVSRVAAAFNNNGHNVRGDMQATITAILLDPEARANDDGGNDLPGDGHLQEPALYIAGMVRAFGGQMNDQNYYSGELANMGEDVFNPSSVFNYYSENYNVAGTSMMGGEFEIYSPNNAIVRANEIASLFGQYSNPIQSYGPGTSIDLTPFLPLASSPTTLVNALDLTLTHGIMPAAMKSAIVTAVGNDSGGSLHQVQTACYLILTSSYYNVWH